jgi:hypothetical protein
MKRLISLARLTTLGVLTLQGCSADKPVSVEPPTKIEAVSATTVAGTAGALVSPSPAVKVTGASGKPIAGVHVSFAISEGAGSITGSIATSDANGIATVGSWTLGTVAGVSNSLTATVTGLSQTVIFTASAAAGPAVNVLVVASTNNQTADGGHQVPINPAVKAADAFGNGVGNVSIKFDVTVGDGFIFTNPNSPTPNKTLTSATDVTGTASVIWVLGTFDVTNTLVATATGLTGSPVTLSATGVPDPIAAEGLARSALRTWFNAYEGLNAVGPLATQARTYSASWNNANMNFYSGVDNPSASADQWNRNTRSWQNTSTATERTSPIWFWSGGTNQESASALGFTDGLSTATTLVRLIRKNGIVVRDAAGTKRAEALAVLMQGAALMGIALNYDKGFVVDENTDPAATTAYSNRKQMRDAAIAKLSDAAAIAGANSFLTPADWTNGRSYTNTDVARIASTMAAMTLAYYPRDATENAAVNWTQVATFAAAGMSSGTPVDFVFTGDGCASWCPEVLFWFNSMDLGRLSTRVARLLDPATQTDPWPSVGNPRPNSADKRMGDGSFGTTGMESAFGNVAKTAAGGTDFAWSSKGDIFSAGRGSYHQSNIAHIRYDLTGQQSQSGIYGGIGTVPVMSATLNDLLWAEASLRTGNASQAATLINKTRVTRGGLAAAAAGDGIGTDSDGPCTSAATLAKDGTTPCTLMAKLLYEKEVELLGLGAASFYEQRKVPLLTAAGRFVQGLIPGTPREMPVPYTVLTARGEPVYTWGGSSPANSPTPP